MLRLNVFLPEFCWNIASQSSKILGRNGSIFSRAKGIRSLKNIWDIKRNLTDVENNKTSGWNNMHFLFWAKIFKERTPALLEIPKECISIYFFISSPRRLENIMLRSDSNHSNQKLSQNVKQFTDRFALYETHIIELSCLEKKHKIKMWTRESLKTNLRLNR